jgi:hypothetical protein
MAKLEDNYAERLRKEWGALPYDQIAVIMERLRNDHDEIKRTAALVWAEYELLTQEVIPSKMDRDNIQNVTIQMPDGSRRQLRVLDQLSVKTPADKKADLWQWLQDHDAEALITSTVNSSTLAAFVREQIKKGGEIPSEICEITSWTAASLVKA